MSDNTLRMPNGEPDKGNYVPYSSHNQTNFRERMAQYRDRTEQNPEPVFLGTVTD